MSRKAFVRRNERLRISDKTEAWECIREISPRYGIRVIVIFRNFVEIGRVERPPLPLEKKKVKKKRRRNVTRSDSNNAHSDVAQRDQ